MTIHTLVVSGATCARQPGLHWHSRRAVLSSVPLCATSARVDSNNHRIEACPCCLQRASCRAQLHSKANFNYTSGRFASPQTNWLCLTISTNSRRVMQPTNSGSHLTAIDLLVTKDRQLTVAARIFALPVTNCGGGTPLPLFARCCLFNSQRCHYKQLAAV